MPVSDKHSSLVCPTISDDKECTRSISDPGINVMKHFAFLITFTPIGQSVCPLYNVTNTPA